MKKEKNKRNKYTDEERILKGFELEYTWWEKLLLPFSKAWYRSRDKREVKKYRRQRAKRGYSDYDVLDFQMWHVRTVRPMLENMLENLFSYPDEISFEEWQDVLKEMIHLLRLMDTEDESRESYSKICDERTKASTHFFELFGKWFWDLGY